MLNRRTFLGMTAALPAMAAWPAAAHTLDAQIQEAALPEDMQPRMVNLGLGLAPYEIHVDPVVFALFWTQPDGWAWRYPVGIGREGLYESGEFFVGAKKEWPSWTPTPDMIEREPDKYKQYEDGMPGGLENPLGSRALYLFTEEKGDTFLRIHGTNDPSTIGKRVSNGCARLTNDQIIDLYNRVPENTRVVLYPTM